MDEDRAARRVSAVAAFSGSNCKAACCRIVIACGLLLAFQIGLRGQLAVVGLNRTAQVPPSVVRYLNHGSYRFCFEKDSPGLTSLVVEDSRGKLVASVNKTHECEQRTLHSGSYRFRLGYDAGLVGAGKLAFLKYNDPLFFPKPPLVNPNGKLAGGYWAIAPLSLANNRELPGRVMATPPYVPIYGSEGMPVIGNPAGFSYDDYALFDFSNGNAPKLLANPGDQRLDIYTNTGPGPADPGLLVVRSPAATGSDIFDTSPLTITDLGKYQFQASVNTSSGPKSLAVRPSSPAGVNTLGFSATVPAATFNVRFRYYPDGTQIEQLNPGEAAIYQQCNYQGKAIVIWGGIDSEQLTSAVTTLLGTGVSVRLGEDVILLGLAQPAVNGQPPPTAIITADAPCLSKPLDRYIGSDTPILTVSFGISCPNCELSNFDLSASNFAGIDFHGSRFIGSSFAQSSLQGANLDGAKLNNAILDGAHFENAHLVGADLTGATIAGATLTGADFTSATLSGLNFTNFELTGTRFSNANLAGANLSSAKLYSAQLDNANLDGANMAGSFLTKAPSGEGAAVNLQGAFLRNVNLSASRISGVDFSNASFFSTVAAGTSTCGPVSGFTNNCATAAGAVMEGTNFGSAYLFGADFNGANMQGVSFTNAVLTGVNFNNATLAPAAAGTATNLSGALIQGTNLTGAIIPSSLSLASAFVDFTVAGNTINIQLPGTHTLFPGYWGAAGEPVCAQMVYNNATAVPTTGPETTCPDGIQHGNGCGPASTDGSNLNWKSPVDITQFASYLNNSTYTNAPAGGNPFCTADLLWIPIDIVRKDSKSPNVR